MYEDPLYVDANSGDYRLDEDSPCRGAAEGGEDMGAIPYYDEETIVTPVSFGYIKAIF
jgi:hypothetical protein